MIEVKKIYMDLKEAKKDQGRDVWMLESETFKDPITLQIEYSNKDKERIESKKREIESQEKATAKLIETAVENLKEQIEVSKKYKEECQIKDDKIAELTKRLEKSGKEKVQILKEANKLKERVDEQDGQINAMKEILSEIKKKVTKEPRVYSGQTFLSGNGISALTGLKIPNGNYIVSEVLRIVEKNEYVENEDREVHAYNMHISDGLFVPEYDLIGTTELDTPTATIDRTFTLLPY